MDVTYEELMWALKATIKSKRKELGKPRRELAEAVHLTAPAWVEYETFRYFPKKGVHSGLTVQSLYLVAKALEETPEGILADAHDLAVRVFRKGEKHEDLRR